MDNDSGVQYVCGLYVKACDPWTMIVLSCMFLLILYSYLCTLLWLFQHIPENVILNIVVYCICVFIMNKCMTLAACYLTQPKYMTLGA